MAQTVNYADILANVVQAEGLLQPGLQPIKIAAVCDRQTGHFLLIATGWENNQRFDSILFHARLVHGKVIIESDYTEEGLTATLVDVGICAADVGYAEASPAQSFPERLAA